MKKVFLGLTVLALAAMVAAPALAYPPIGNDIQVENKNKAKVSNEVDVGAYTGGNSAYGGDAGDGGHTGKVKAQKGGTAITGDGGNGGAGGDGGTITTGDAYAKGKVVNIVNKNKTKIKVTCDGCDDIDDSIVKNKNKAKVRNYLDVYADTSYNWVDGGEGGDGGNTGKVKAQKGGTAISGNGGEGGDGGNGGRITTGNAYAKGKVINVVNTNITRIRR